MTADAAATYIQNKESRQFLVPIKCLNVDNVLWKMSKSLHMSFAAVMHLAEEVCLIALLALKVENSLIFI
jgi:hypothetical protein